MKTVVLNESFLQAKHLSRLRKLGEVVEYDNTSTEEEVVDRTKSAEVAIADCFIAPLNAKALQRLDGLKLLAINSTGYDLVDTKAAAAKDIKVANVPNFSTDAVAEHTIALMFAAIRKVALGDKEMRKEPFQIDPANKEQQRYLGFNLRGKTLGVIGLGQIGSRVAELGQSLGMNVVGYNRTPKQLDGVVAKSLEEVLSESDVVSLHLAFEAGLENLIGKTELKRMKPTAILVNTARGTLVETKALNEALKNGTVAGAGLDVLAEWDKDNPLLALDNVVLTPHSAFFTHESLENMAEIIVQNVEAFAKGNPINIVGDAT